MFNCVFVKTFVVWAYGRNYGVVGVMFDFVFGDYIDHVVVVCDDV